MKYKKCIIVMACFLLMNGCGKSNDEKSLSVSGNFAVTATGQKKCYNNQKKIRCPKEKKKFYGQDAQHSANHMQYTDNGDGTVTDNVTGLMWQKKIDDPMTYADALKGNAQFNYAGYTDWRLPTITELYSLAQYGGEKSNKTKNKKKVFIDVEYFDILFDHGSEDQFWFGTINKYAPAMFGDDPSIFSFNFFTGALNTRLIGKGEQQNKFYFLHVRGDGVYGKNEFIEEGDAIVFDNGSGLYWQKKDSEKSMNWSDALQYCADLKIDEYDDWRLPNAKELQSIVDYSNAPDITNTASINGVFSATMLVNDKKEENFPYYWTSTTYVNNAKKGYAKQAVVTAFGRTNNDAVGTGSQEFHDKVIAEDVQNNRYYYVRCVR